MTSYDRLLQKLRFLLLSILFFFSATLVLAAGAKIKNIEYQGNNRISNETIFAYLDLNVGEEIDQSKINDSVKKLFNTGFFLDVKIFQKGNALMVDVKENPMINKIAFDGNKKLEDSDLQQELSLKQNTVFSPYKLQSDLNRMISLYQKRGRYSVQIEPKIIKLDQNRVNLVYEIDEGPAAVIQKINFSGNNNFTSSELSDVIVSKEYRFYRFFSSADVFDPDKMEFDKELLRRFYLSKGYADFKVTASTSELSLKKDAFLLTFIINEGIVYSYGNVEINNNIKNLDVEPMKAFVTTLQPGKKFNQEEVDAAVDSLTNYLGNHGYPFVEVDPEVVTHPETALADIKFNIKESYRVYIRKINIKNNTRTLDEVIRREFRIAEGDPYNISKIQRSKQRIENLDFFSKVDFKNQKTDASDKMDLEVEVEEKSTGSINFAAGYNTSTGVLGQISLTESNFLGKGQQVSISTTLAQRERDVTFSFTEPYFMGRDLSAGFDIFTNKRDYKSVSSFNSKVVGAGLRLGYELTEHLSHGLRYVIKKERITDVSSDASIYVKEQAGNNLVSLVGHTLVYDRLDSKVEPTSGYLGRFEQDVAGLGGNTKYFSNTITGVYYYPVYKKDFILKVLGRAGHIMGYGGKQVKINDRFTIGPDYIRGFDVGGIGPRDKSTFDALGGKTYYTTTVELSFPLGLPSEVGLKGAIFHDMGALFGLDKVDKSKVFDKSSLRASVGGSLIWKAPIGTIGIHYGIPYKKEKFDDVRHFYLDFGYKF